MKKEVIIITGATSMIGCATAHLFNERNIQLILIGRSLTKLAALTSRLNANVITYALDICDSNAISQTITEIKDKFQRIDCIIQNTAIYPYKPIESLDLLEWNNTLAATLTGPFLFTKACISTMKKQRHGKIIFISSIAGEIIGLPNMSAYAAAKAGLNGLMRTTAIELAPYNINVNSISPGKIYAADALTKEEMTEKLQSVPLKRFITPDDIAKMALFLASDQAKNITGQNIIIDGGQSILAENSHLTSNLF
ncbi:MAG: SDR family oxidoreductase [Gammaproteobacteria bacterium]|nr:SDR family oxidoreductase [Gammaproteobacteria bacterium]